MTKPIVAPPCLPYRVIVKGHCLDADVRMRRYTSRLYWAISDLKILNDQCAFTVWLTGTDDQNVAALNRWYTDGPSMPPYRNGTLLLWWADHVPA